MGICKLRKEFGISRADSFSRRFRATYGKDAFERFKEIINRPDASLSDVGRYFGFSRQYASAVYKKIHGRSYSEVCERRRKTGKDAKEIEKLPKQLRQVSDLRIKMAALGFVTQLRKKKYGYYIATNGFKLAVRCASTYRTRGRKAYFQTTNLKGMARFDYDFLIVVCTYGNDHIYFIIPRDAVPDGGLSLIPRESSSSKYSKFRGAWHLLVTEAKTGRKHSRS